MQVGRYVTGDKCWYVYTHTDQSVNFQIKPTLYHITTLSIQLNLIQLNTALAINYRF